MTDNKDFLHELRIGVAALQRGCYEVIGACAQIDYALRLLDNPLAKPAQENITVTSDSSSNSMSVVTDSNKPFTPITKPQGDKGNPLAELLHQMSPEDRAKLAVTLEQNLSKE